MDLIERGGHIDEPSLRMNSQANSRATRSRQNRSRAMSSNGDGEHGRRSSSTER